VAAPLLNVLAGSRCIGIAGLALAAMIFVSPASGVGGRYTISGGTARERAQVRDALRASSFNWSTVPQTVRVEIERGAGSHATPGQIVLDADLLDAGIFSWGVVQHEFAHQVDFLLFDEADRADLESILGGTSWWPGEELAHGQLTCERFASTLAWAYWPSPANVMQPPAGGGDEASSMTLAAFRAVVNRIVRAHEIYSVSRK
jgi:hypothetical protein